jgi:hypothetical protein
LSPGSRISCSEVSRGQSRHTCGPPSQLHWMVKFKRNVPNVPCIPKDNVPKGLHRIFHRVVTFYVCGSRFQATRFTDPQDSGFVAFLPSANLSKESLPPLHLREDLPTSEVPRTARPQILADTMIAPRPESNPRDL